eukprot:TRINITY_DN2100_c0_g1_i1.p1 TRINITY_DN2100_c0_g1~~TRINITY_DN2100_c0_g1_i1.p1  ORF type:complete len:174 (+),score=2.93 TRINITY_DN2100_c0_g1_i1:749-1270(+)
MHGQPLASAMHMRMPLLKYTVGTSRYESRTRHSHLSSHLSSHPKRAFAARTAGMYERTMQVNSARSSRRRYTVLSYQSSHRGVCGWRWHAECSSAQRASCVFVHCNAYAIIENHWTVYANTQAALACRSGNCARPAPASALQTFTSKTAKAIRYQLFTQGVQVLHRQPYAVQA